MLQRYLIGTALVLWTVILNAAEPTPIFYAKFDGDATPEIAQGKNDASVQGTVTWVDGVDGKAAVCGTSGCIVYSALGNLNPQQGALSVWMRPVDWQPNDNKLHFLFSAVSENPESRERLLLYKYINTLDILAFSDGPAGKDPHAAKKEMSEWVAEDWQKWHHYVMNWTDNEIVLFIDGEEAADSPRTQSVADDWKYFAIGTEDGSQEAGNSAFDEFKIFDRPLTQAEVAELFSKDSKHK